MKFISELKNRLRPYRDSYESIRRQRKEINSYFKEDVLRKQASFDQLKQFKDIHKGERCFIVATGPSLTIEDIEKLKGEICWTCNSGINLFDKTDWRPKYYAIADGRVFEKVKEKLNPKDFGFAFYNDKDIEWTGENVLPLPVYVSYVLSEEARAVLPKWALRKRMSNDISQKVYMGDNITFVIMQICMYMGFSEIYLLGCDCNYSGAKSHSSLTDYKDAEKLYKSADAVYRGMIDDHKCAKKIAGKRGVRIYNATRGGMLEVYPRVNLDKI